jgi:hypothetical protein
MKKTKLPSPVTLAILTLITVVFWISFGVLRILTAKPSPKVSAEILNPLTPTLDTETLNKIESGIFFEQ